MRNSLVRLGRAAALGGLLCAGTTYGAPFQLINIDPPGVGFNDPTPAPAVGGNTGTTIGQQRLNAYQRALELWGSVLKSNVTIHVVGSFSAFPANLCAGNVLARAGAIQIFANFPNAPQADTWYPVALANSLAGTDLAPGGLTPDVDFEGADVLAQFNGGIGQPNCIPGSSWYYGLDNNPPANQIDFLNTFMHEVAHGLGFGNFITETDGLPPAYPDLPYPDIYMRNTLDTDLGLTWDQLTPEQIVASASNGGKVVWSGRRVTNSADDVLGPLTGIKVVAPSTIAGERETGTATFGPRATAQNFSGQIVQAVDAGGTSLDDGCEAIGPAVAGKIALVDRGTCTFLLKAQNAQAAGAAAVLIVNNTPGVVGMPGTDPNLTIPTLMIPQGDGNSVKAHLPNVRVTVFVDPSRLAGANAAHQVRLYAPSVIALGSSISHFDTAADPNLIMEPSITPTLKASTNVDLTAQLFKDIGWPIESLKIGQCDTRVPGVTPVGDLLAPQVEQCAADTDRRGEFVACVTHVGTGLTQQKFINSRDFARMVVCARAVGDRGRAPTLPSPGDRGRER